MKRFCAVFLCFLLSVARAEKPAPAPVEPMLCPNPIEMYTQAGLPEIPVPAPADPALRPNLIPTPSPTPLPTLNPAPAASPVSAPLPAALPSVSPSSHPSASPSAAPMHTDAALEFPSTSLVPVTTRLVLITLPPSPAPTPRPTVRPTPLPTPNAVWRPDEEMDAMARELLTLVNNERRLAGLSELVWNEELARAARIRARETVISFSHTRPDGSSWASVSPLVRSENLAMGFSSSHHVMSGWLGSPSHRANIFHESFTSMGAAVHYSDGIYYWVQLFAD